MSKYKKKLASKVYKGSPFLINVGIFFNQKFIIKKIIIIFSVKK